MPTRRFWGIFIAVVIMLMLAGCKSSGNGQSAAPQPSPQQAAVPKAASASPARTVGHTEIKDASGHPQPAFDDGDHCFMRDNSRDLVLTFTDPAVKSGTVSAYLIDVVNGIVDDEPEIDDKTTPGIATIRFSDQGAPSPNTRSSHRGSRNTLHLGPGPYVEVTTVNSTGARRANAAGPQLPTADIFPYITVDDPKIQCH